VWNFQKRKFDGLCKHILCSKNPEKSEKKIKITKKGNLIDYVSRLSCAKNSEKIPKNIKKYRKI
jgi:hypothetical protein